MDSWADLHIHTYYSDSTSSPQEVVDGALKEKLSCVAITDHDTIDGFLPTTLIAQAHGIEVIAGVELSSEWEGRDIDILGYCFDCQQSPLVEQLDVFLDARVERMKQMIVQLKTAGINNIEYEEVSALTKSRAVGRVHLATLLVAKGWTSSMKEAFEKYLGPGRVGYVPKFQQTPFEAIDLIKKSGGVAVMAHPMLTQKDELIPQFVKAGMQGIEVYYPNCNPLVTQCYERIAKKHGLIATGGSDAHGKVKAYTHVGKMVVSYSVVEQLKQAMQKTGTH